MSTDSQEEVHKNCLEGFSKDQQLEKQFYLKSTSASHLPGLEGYSSLRFKIWLPWVTILLKHWRLA